MRQVEHHERRGRTDLAGDLLVGFGGEVVVLVQRGRGGKQAEPLVAADHHPLQQHRIQTVGLVERVGHALQRVLIEVEPGGAESQVEVDHHRVRLHPLGEGVGEVVGDGRRARTALDAHEGHLPAGEGRGRVAVEGGDGADQLQRLQRRGQVFRNAPPHQIAIEGDVVGRPNDDHLGAGIADLRQLIEQADQHFAGFDALDHHQRGGGLVLIELHGGRQAPGPHHGRGSRQAPIATCLVDQRRGRGFVAEHVDGDARDRVLVQRRLGPGLHLADRIGRVRQRLIAVGWPGQRVGRLEAIGRAERLGGAEGVRRRLQIGPVGIGRQSLRGQLELVVGVEADAEILMRAGTGGAHGEPPPMPEIVPEAAASAAPAVDWPARYFSMMVVRRPASVGSAARGPAMSAGSAIWAAMLALTAQPKLLMVLLPKLEARFPHSSPQRGITAS